MVKKSPAAPKPKVVYLDADGCAYTHPPGRRQAKQLTREELGKLAVKYSVIIEKVD